MTRLFLISFLILLNIGVYSQESLLQDSSFIYWTSNRIIRFGDFQQILDSHAIKLLTKYNAKSLTNVQIHCILDYPKNKRDMKLLGEQWYFAPVFCKKCSPIIEQDSIELKYALMYFDIAEYCTRVTRKKIVEFLNKNPGKGFIAAAFPRLTEETYKLMREMFASFSKQVIDDKTPGSFENWRDNVNKMLDNTMEFATQKKDCQRFINKKPFSDKYRVVYSLYGQNV